MSLSVDDRRGRRSSSRDPSRSRRDRSRSRLDGEADDDILLSAQRDRSPIPPGSASPMVFNAFGGPPRLSKEEFAHLPSGFGPSGGPADDQDPNQYRYDDRGYGEYDVKYVAPPPGASSSSLSSSRRRADSFRASSVTFAEDTLPPTSSKVSRYLDNFPEKDRRKDRYEDDLAYGRLPESGPSSAGVAPSTSSATLPSRYGGQLQPQQSLPQQQQQQQQPQRDSWYGSDPRVSAPSVLTVEPPGARRERERSRPRSGTSPAPPVGRMSTLTVNTDSGGGGGGGRGHSKSHSLSLSAAAGAVAGAVSAAASPLLEAYRGTWQQTSPLPSPLLTASHSANGYPGNGAGFETLSLAAAADEERNGGTRRRRARFHDSEDNVTRIAHALKGEGPPDIEPLIEILPGLSDRQVMELRAEYKAMVKTGPDRKGVNVAKHIRARLKDADPSLMKAAYATALGQWESEAYWANFWYQADKTRRELLIESLMGRTNYEIHRIKAAFNDKKYDNSLSRCMRTELKEDKFKKAVMMVLEERRMEEFDADGHRLPVSGKLVDDDVDGLRRVIKARHGGESVMIAIVVNRSDSHLREVLKEYEKAFGSNFARDALEKSGNLVGELLVHILNGVINKPVRDAVLLHHALTASRKDPLRRELLISRLVRVHWDQQHMLNVKAEFAARYGVSLQQAVAEAASHAWGEFCCELCITRVPDDIKVFVPQHPPPRME